MYFPQSLLTHCVVTTIINTNRNNRRWEFDGPWKKKTTSNFNRLTLVLSISDNITLFDFTKLDNVSNWTEQSDTVRTVGKSKAVITLQKTQEFQRGIFFTLLNPQPNGAGFAGVRTETHLNLTGLTNIDIDCRGQGEVEGYKVVLRHRGQDNEPHPTYEQFFTVRL